MEKDILTLLIKIALISFLVWMGISLVYQLWYPDDFATTYNTIVESSDQPEGFFGELREKRPLKVPQIMLMIPLILVFYFVGFSPKLGDSGNPHVSGFFTLLAAFGMVIGVVYIIGRF